MSCQTKQGFLGQMKDFDLWPESNRKSWHSFEKAAFEKITVAAVWRPARECSGQSMLSGSKISLELVTRRSGERCQ